jgi:hypothetical protein
MGFPVAHPAIQEAFRRGLVVEPQPRPRPAGESLSHLVAALPEGLSEKRFMAAVIRLALSNGFEVYHTHDSRRSNPGLPDLLLCKPGVLFAVELKVKGNKPTAAQRRWLALLGTVPGVRARTYRPELWSAVVAELSANLTPGDTGPSG